MYKSKNTIVRLLQPSRLSFVVGVGASFAAVLTSAYHYVYVGSQVEYYTSLVLNGQNGFMQNASELTERINGSEFAASTSLFFTWAMLGVGLYALVMGLLHLVTGSATFVGMLKFLPVQRRGGFILEAGEHLLLRLLGGILLFAIYKICLLVSPYALLMLDGLKNQPSVLNMMLVAILISLCVSLVVHLITVCLRLILVRERTIL